MVKLFGTDGVRGVANTELTPQLAFALGQAGAYALSLKTKGRTKIVIGKDTRISSDMLEAAITAGICSTGCDAELVGVVPTPAVAYLTRKLNADAGVVISASHNSMEYNGIKFFDKQGYKLSDSAEEEIETIIGSGIKIPNPPVGEKLGRVIHNSQAKFDYIDFVENITKQRLNGVKIALDCANGAASEIAGSVFRKLGAEVFLTNDKPDGLNINKDCGSTHLEQIQGFTTETGADIGLAFDGDADRVLAVDETGNIVDGDKIVLICANDAKNRGLLRKNTVVATVMSNLGMFLAAKKLGINIVRANVGDRYVLEEMIKNGYNIGGEQSGHIIFLDYNTTGDGLITAVTLASVMKQSEKKLSELAKIMQKLPQVLVNVKVKAQYKNTYFNDNDIKTEIEKIEKSLADKGRVLIRPSGTEPLIRVMIEGPDFDIINEKAKALAKLIKRKTG